METFELKGRHQRMLECLYFNDKITVNQMQLTISDSEIYTSLRELAKDCYIHISYVENTSGSGRKYVKAYELTEKGKNFMDERKWRKLNQ